MDDKTNIAEVIMAFCLVVIIISFLMLLKVTMFDSKRILTLELEAVHHKAVIETMKKCN